MKIKSIIIACGLAGAAIMTASFVASTYKRDAEFERFIHDLDMLTDAIVDRISEEPSPARLAEAQEMLDVMKVALGQKLAELKTVDAAWVSGETLLRFQGDLARNGSKISRLLDNAELKRAARRDPKFRQQVLKLHADYLLIIRGEQEGL